MSFSQVLHVANFESTLTLKNSQIGGRFLAGADLDLKARGGIVAREARGGNFRGVASLRAAQRTYVYDN